MELFEQIKNNYVKFENKLIRVITADDGLIWFNANDTANAIGYVRIKKAISDNIHNDEKNKG
jgi:prophage antirepressor-like protein